jgi:hypothetical protein
MPRSLDELEAENERLTRVLDDGARAQLMALPDVVHVAVGLRERGGLATDEFTLKVFVDEKVAAAELPPDRLIPVAIANVGTDVCAVPTGRFHADDSRERPLVGGTQITNGIKVWESDAHTTSISAGTLGTVVYRRSDSAPAILTCWHVVTVHGGKEGDPLFQPAPNPDKTPDRETTPIRNGRTTPPTWSPPSARRWYRPRSTVRSPWSTIVTRGAVTAARTPPRTSRVWPSAAVTR